jgi:hypothetical protein
MQRNKLKCNQLILLVEMMGIRDNHRFEVDSEKQRGERVRTSMIVAAVFMCGIA